MVILEIVNDNRTKRNSCLLKLKRSQNQKNMQGRCSRVRSDFLERERPPSLDLYAIQPLKSSGQEGELLYAERASRGYQI